MLLLCLLLALSGCQAISPGPTGPTRTPILLGTAAVPAAPATSVVPSPTPAVTPSPQPAVVTAAEAPAAEASKPAATSTATPAAHILTLGTRPAIVLRTEPAANAGRAAQLAGSAVLWAEGRSADGRWLWVSYGDRGGLAWIPAAEVKVLGDTASLPVVSQRAAIAPAPGTEAGAAASARPAATRAPVRLPGKLAFQTASGGDIYVVNADGTGLRRVTDGIDPALSPDGKQLAFARWSAPHGIFVVDLATGEERRVASANQPRSPVWSSDGSTIAFAHLTGSSTCRSTPFGCISEGQLRAQFRGQECIDSPIGRLCIGDFPVRQIDESGIAQVPATGEGWLDLGVLGDAQSPDWNPKTGELLYRGGAGLQITAPGQTSREVIREPSVSSPAWSPDGQRIAVQMRQHDNTDIFLLDAAGNTIKRLTAPPSDTVRAPNNVAPAWSPDGRWIVFLSDRDGAWRLYRMNADGSGQTLLLPGVLGEIPIKYDFAAERVASWSK